ncbi:MAG: alpha/beta fold hydrolase [Gemmatimonadetes bacterium]|nr:alpha/beta fold hydrolase [Gemmatimonadota bacterium]MCC6769637.1 alpha/beta fold hydrolase [Gemmatimonadaceae bacterium]
MPVILRVVALLAALVPALMVFVGAAAFELGFWTLALLALLAFLGAGFTLLRFAERHLTRRGLSASGAPNVRWWLGGGVAVYALLAQLLVGRAPARTIADPPTSDRTQYWTLGNGSRIAYEMVGAAGGARGAPIVVLHDGPGMPILPFLQAVGRRPLDFAAVEGHDVYYYDQLGAGLSGRLDLTTDAPYSVARHVGDLEEIRRAIGAPRMILAGTGWGATLAVNYLLQHPEHVESVILESPAAIWAPAWPETISPTARARMTDVQASALAALERPPLRLVIGRMMADVSPRSAHTIVADWEADQWWTRATEEAIRLGQPNLTCFSDPGQGIPPPSGLGFFANSYTLADALSLPDPRPTLQTLRVKALVIRGMCDYADWTISAEYPQVIRGTHTVAIPAAGHFVWLEQPALYSEVVRAFLRGEPIPLAAYSPVK